jgi:chromosome segregation ATPase
VAQVTAQLEHARTGNKCTRDALAERNIELKALNDAKEKDNWVLRESLVTAWTKVETLMKSRKTGPVLESPSSSSNGQDESKSVEEGGRPCGEYLTTKLELSSTRNHMLEHQKKSEGFRKALIESRAETINFKDKLERANESFSHLQQDANTARWFHEKLQKHADKLSVERRTFEKQLKVAQVELQATKLDLTASEARS